VSPQREGEEVGLIFLESMGVVRKLRNVVRLHDPSKNRVTLPEGSEGKEENSAKRRYNSEYCLHLKKVWTEWSASIPVYCYSSVRQFSLRTITRTYVMFTSNIQRTYVVKLTAT
jgi:hypothetical protein